MNLKHLSIHLKERLSIKLEESKAERLKGSIELKKYREEISYLKKKATNEGSGEQLDFIVVHRKGMLGWVNRGGDYEAVGGVRNSDNTHYQGEYNEDNNQYVVGSVTGSPIVYDMFTLGYKFYTGNTGTTNACAWQSPQDFVCGDDNNDIRYFHPSASPSYNNWHSANQIPSLLVLQNGWIVCGDNWSDLYYITYL